MNPRLMGEDEPVNNYNEHLKLMEGALIKLGDYAHFRYFFLYRNGKICYYELPLNPLTLMTSSSSSSSSCSAPSSPTNADGASSLAENHVDSPPPPTPSVSSPPPSSSTPQRIQLCLTPQHLRGVMFLHPCVAHGNSRPANEEEEIWPNKNAFMFNRKKLELNLTGYSLTGQLTSWQLRAGNDQSYMKWEKALRLALRPIWIQNTPHCLICHEPFTFLFRPHHCRKCGTCICENCSLFAPRLPIQGYYEAVRICRDCSPIRIECSELAIGTRVLVYGIYPGKVVAVRDPASINFSSSPTRGHCSQMQQMPLKRADSGGGTSQEFDYVCVELEKRKCSRRFGDSKAPVIGRFRLEFVELYSEVTLSANRIKNAIRRHLSYTLFRTQLNFNTWNILESIQEHKTVQMVRILNKSSSITELRSMVPTLGSLETMQTQMSLMNYGEDENDQEPQETGSDRSSWNEKEEICASLEKYRGVHVVFPIRMDTVIKLLDQFRNGMPLHRVYVYQILDEAERFFRDNPAASGVLTTIELSQGTQLIVVGDLHGQLEDLLTIFERNGNPSATTWYLFNGDYVDRGSHGVEVMMIILSFKLLFPDFVFLNRGNHEERVINEVFGFEDELYVKYHSQNDQVGSWPGLEAVSKYSPMQLFDKFENVFQLLPLCALVNKSVFVCHGGLSHHPNVRIEDFLEIKHHREVPTQSLCLEDELFTHLLWSDPRDQEGYDTSRRGAGVEFGPDITKNFCLTNELNLIIRSHECQQEGYSIIHDGLLLTIFSASNYGGTQTNKGAFAVLEVAENDSLKPRVVQFFAQPLQRLRDASKNEWRLKAVRLERRTLMSLMELICEKKTGLLSGFHRVDTQNSGRVSKMQWKQVLQQVLGVDICFLSYFNQLATEEQDEKGGIDYKSFLNRYVVELNAESFEWRRHLLRKVWTGFCEALAAAECLSDEEEDSKAQANGGAKCRKPTSLSDKKSMQYKLQAAFALFDQNVSSSGKPNSRRGYVGYDVFRSTILTTLKLSDTLSEQQVFELMQHMDQKQDGVIDFEEFCSFFGEFSRSEHLQQLFEVIDAKGFDLLHRFGTYLTSYSTFKTLDKAFECFDRHNKSFLTADDLQFACKSMEMIPELTSEECELLYKSILRAFYGDQSSHPAGTNTPVLSWHVFEDVFSLDSTSRRSLMMSSMSASTSSDLNSLGSPFHPNGDHPEPYQEPNGNGTSAVPTSTSSMASFHEMLDDSVAPSPSSLKRYQRQKSFVDALVDQVKHTLHEHRLYMKFLFRLLDPKRVGQIDKKQFVLALNTINEENGNPLQKFQIEQLAGAFSVSKLKNIQQLLLPRGHPSKQRMMAFDSGASSRDSSTTTSPNGSSRDEAVAYPFFLNSLHVVDSENPPDSNGSSNSSFTYRMSGGPQDDDEEEIDGRTCSYSFSDIMS